ncbi:dickkopf-related protein 3a isoform X2 [Cynoglossus semilaevis]|uniref:Dickkopf WNT signaling pathway inhibitor 3a n=1 Tax=Cynoglossus semilaevis TaxID=244447 RepID=A0A3P8WYP5_CYNSE|nr:dickkopf-related protein 3 isoform X2 [Cynoglossus semilaevis]
MMSAITMRLILLFSAVTAVCHGILPEIINSGISHILEEHPSAEETELERKFVDVEQLQEDPQRSEPEHPLLHNDMVSVSPGPDLLPDHFNESNSDKVTDSGPHTSLEQETNNITSTADHDSDLGNYIDLNVKQSCITDDDCGKDRYCFNAVHGSECMSCKAIDVPCTKDKECCGDQLCVWGQCSQNATKGEAGSTCEYQSECRPELCCAYHQALHFSVCLAKPIERERCFGASNHLMELLNWNIRKNEPRKHCPCAGDLHCQHLGRGSMCLRGEGSSEEELEDTLYSEIDYII